MARRLFLTIAAAGLGATALAACSSSSSSSSEAGSSATTVPAETTTTLGTAFSAQGFTTVVPPGWKDLTNNSSSVSAIAPASGTAGATVALFQQPNPGTEVGHISIATVSPSVADADVAAYLASAGQNGATNLSQPQSFTLDGSTGQFITYDAAQTTGAPTKDQDMVVNHGSTTYDIVFNVPSDQFDTLTPGLQAVLAAWHWTS